MHLEKPKAIYSQCMNLAHKWNIVCLKSTAVVKGLETHKLYSCSLYLISSSLSLFTLAIHIHIKMEVLSNKIDRRQLKPGDHIYVWRQAYLYAHHGYLFFILFLCEFIFIFIYVSYSYV